MKCSHEDGCSASATHGYTWPGKERAYLCESHMDALSKVTNTHLLDIATIRPAVASEIEVADEDFASPELDELDHP